MQSLTPEQINVLKDLRQIYRVSKKLEFVEEKAVWRDVIENKCERFGLSTDLVIVEDFVFDMICKKSLFPVLR